MYMGFQTGTRCETSLSDSCKNAPMSKKNVREFRQVRSTGCWLGKGASPVCSPSHSAGCFVPRIYAGLVLV